MHRLLPIRVLAAMAVALGLIVTPASPTYAGRTKAVWEAVDIDGPGDRREDEKLLRWMLQRESRRADWGTKRPPPYLLRMRVTEFDAELRDGVLYVRCVATGKLRGVGAARSRIGIGGHPSDRARLRRAVLAMTARGVVTRLAQMARGDR